MSKSPCTRPVGGIDEGFDMAGFGPLISVKVLKNHLASPDWRADRPANWRIIDCRFDLLNPAAGRNAWLESHIPGAVYADLDNDLAGPVTDDSGRHPLPALTDLKQTFSRLGVSAESNVVVYDGGGGGIAARAWWLLRWLGHDKVALLDGGYAHWLDQGGPIETGEVQTTATDFVAEPALNWLMTTPDVQALTAANKATCLVDARDRERFAGISEPIDRVAGHIPGTRNLPFSETLGADGRFKSAQALCTLWASTLADRPPEDWGVMCGSGVTACHLALSAELAGLPRPRLYVGSWSEWIRDPARAVATGH